LLLTVASLAYFGFVRGGCVCPIGATQNVALAVAEPSYIVPLTVIVFFTLPLVFTLFFGRTFCAAVCPLGAVQELVTIRSISVPRWLDQSLGLLAYIYLGSAVILAATNTAFVICRFDPFVAMFRLSGSAAMLIFGGCLLIIGVVVGRPYCRYLCPYGAILRVVSRFSKWHVRIPPAACINCRLCEDACPYDAIRTPTVAESAEQQRRGKTRLVATLVAAPVLVVGGAVFGGLLGEPLASWQSEVQLAEQLRLEELGLATETTDATDAFRSAGRSPREAYATAIQWRERYRGLGTWLGGWVGLVVSAKLVQLSLRRQRTEFLPDRSGCVACGRCFWYCPVEQVRLGLISDVSQVVPEVPR
jgi:polyferredoxin